jgi:serine protease Do
VVTAAHVVYGASGIAIKLHDRRVLRARLVGMDLATDIALLKVDTPEPVQPVLGRSINLRTGDWVLAIGQPYGMDLTVGAGIVGGMNRHFEEDRDSVFIQTDVALNPGNSGGPLVSMSGDIVGMNSRVVVSQFGSPGLGLSVPIEVVLQVAADLQEGRRIVRPRLGARFSDVPAPWALSAGRPYASGALVREVDADGVAQRSGLRAGDVVVSMNGQPIGDSADLVRLLLNWRQVPGTTLVVFRNGQDVTLGLR